jgi:hypothetical protein
MLACAVASVLVVFMICELWGLVLAMPLIVVTTVVALRHRRQGLQLRLMMPNRPARGKGTDGLTEGTPLDESPRARAERRLGYSTQ